MTLYSPNSNSGKMFALSSIRNLLMNNPPDSDTIPHKTEYKMRRWYTYTINFYPPNKNQLLILIRSIYPACSGHLSILYSHYSPSRTKTTNLYIMPTHSQEYKLFYQIV